MTYVAAVLCEAGASISGPELVEVGGGDLGGAQALVGAALALWVWKN